jgi:beta-phosphoglucomutase family hydrolase
VSETKLQDIRALIFDMDGVIVDSEPLHLVAYQEFFSKFNIHYTEEHNREFLGCKDVAMAQILIDRLSLPETPESMVKAKESILMRLLKEEAVARPGLTYILDAAKNAGLPLAIASSATLPTINLVVDRLNIRSYFQTLTSGDEVANGKPAPDVFLLAAKRLGVEPQRCLVIEDTYNGIRAAKAAGMMCIAIPCEQTKHQDHSQADLQMCSLEEIEFAKSGGQVEVICHRSYARHDSQASV